MDTIIRDEHDAFQTIVNGLRVSQEGARRMADFRPDQRDLWLKMAEVYAVCATSAYKLAEEAASRVLKS